MRRAFAFLLVCLSTFAILTGAPRPSKNAVAVTTAIKSRILNINNIGINISDRGFLFDDPNGWGDGGCQWQIPFFQRSPIAYDHGPWILGKTNGTPGGAFTLWRSSYSPGPIINGRPALDVTPSDSARFHPYMISRSSGSHDSDVVSWPGDLGAPVDGQGKPLLLGDAMVWNVYNGADTMSYPSDWQVDATLLRYQPFKRLPIEIHETTYERETHAVDDTSLMSNTVFIEWTFINKGTVPIESCYVGLWSDIEIFQALFNGPAIDTSLQLGYCWKTDTSFYYHYAAGYTLLYGPMIPDNGSSAVFRGKTIAGHRNMPLAGFWPIDHDGRRDTNFLWAPNTLAEAWNVARGLDKVGRPIFDPSAGTFTRFPLSGDPVSNKGWVYNGLGNGAAGVLMFCGPFTLAVGDSQWMMTALIPANGADRFASISKLRDNARRLRAMTYNDIASPRTLGIAEGPQSIPTQFALSQNYPNPFNPSTTIRYSLPHKAFVKLAVYDVLGREVAVLVNGEQESGVRETRFDGSGLASGVYFYTLRAGEFTQSRKLLILR